MVDMRKWNSVKEIFIECREFYKAHAFNHRVIQCWELTAHLRIATVENNQALTARHRFLYSSLELTWRKR